jgi:hypothetical protein
MLEVDRGCERATQKNLEPAIEVFEGVWTEDDEVRSHPAEEV